MNPRTRYDLVDYDYLDQLNEKDLQWLQDFTEEYAHANFSHPGKRIHKKKKYKKDSYDRNNARNRCIWTIAKAAGLTTDADILNVVEKKREDKDDY